MFVRFTRELEATLAFVSQGPWGGVPVHAVDANAAWARPGPRLVDGIEELASILDAISA